MFHLYPNGRKPNRIITLFGNLSLFVSLIIGYAKQDVSLFTQSTATKDHALASVASALSLRRTRPLRKRRTRKRRPPLTSVQDIAHRCVSPRAHHEHSRHDHKSVPHDFQPKLPRPLLRAPVVFEPEARQRREADRGAEQGAHEADEFAEVRDAAGD